MPTAELMREELPEETVEFRGFKMWSVKDNWQLLKPFLHDTAVESKLNEMMGLLCNVHSNIIKKAWVNGAAPWKYTPTDKWTEYIDEALKSNNSYLSELAELEQIWLHKLFGQDVHIDQYKGKLYANKRFLRKYEVLRNQYDKKYTPQKDTIEYYQVYGACHWMNRVLEVLLQTALNVETELWQTEFHTVVTFEIDSYIYCADILTEWKNYADLVDFMEYKIYPNYNLN
ncbi:hypothetical protein ABIC59_004592 [Priestia aryabhattai]|uniref:hypothetical protein n=1 Tax=Priestia aryabhattai TaxID=412384 RepID=UPI003393A057